MEPRATTSANPKTFSTDRAIPETLVRQIAVIGAQLVGTLMIAHFLSAEDYGNYALITLVTSLCVTFFGAGLTSALPYFAAKREIEAGFALLVLSLHVVLVTLVLFLLWRLAPMDWLVTIVPSMPPSLTVVAILATPIALFTTLVSSFLQGRQAFRQLNLTLLVQPLTLLAGLLIAIISSSPTLRIVLLLWVGSLTASLAISVLFLCSHAELVGFAQRPTRAVVGRIYSYGVRAHVATVIASFAYRTPHFVLNLVVGPAAVGLFALATQTLERVWILSSSIITVMLPRISALSKANRSLENQVALAARWLTPVGLLAALPLILILMVLQEFVLPAGYDGLVIVALVLSPGIAAYGVTRILSAALAAHDLLNVNLGLSAALLLLVTVLSLILAPALGAVGAALASSLTYLLLALVTANVFGRQFGEKPASFTVPQAGDLRRLAVLARSLTGHRIGR